MSTDYEHRLFGEPYSELERRMRADTGLARALDALADRYCDEQFAVTDLANAAGLSLTALRLRFGQLAGMPPRKFIIRYRAMMFLRRLASTEDNISEVAATAGFCDVSVLNKTFRTLLGDSPRAIRARLRSTISGESPVGQSESPKKC